MLESGTPVVLVLLVGRPYDLSRQADRLGAALCGFFCGEEGAGALADVLAGRVDPSGRLPVSFPGGESTQPSTYLAPRLGAGSEVTSLSPEPLYPFGHGLSLSPTVWEEIRLLSGPRWRTEGFCELAVTLRNPGRRPSAEVVQVYLNDPVAEVVRPLQQLVAFARVELPAGERRRLRMRLHADLTSFTGRDGQRVVEPGEVSLRVGTSSAAAKATLELRLTGPRRMVGFDRRRTAETVIERQP